MKFLKQIILIFVVILVSSCNDTESSSNTDSATLSVKLVDDPGDYQNVYVDIIDVMVKYDGTSEDDDNGWESIGIINPGVYDLLELTGGESLDLVNNVDIETGFIKQIRLVLGDDNSVVLDGETESRQLNTPSAQQSGLKVMINQDINAGYNYDFILDFDVDESIVMAGNSGNINLKPVLRASLAVNSGTISGSLQPTGIAAEITVANEGFSATTFVNESGDFQVLGLPAGFYTVTVTPDSSLELNTISIENVEVNIGEITSLNTIILD